MNGFLTFPIFIAMLLSTSIAHASDDTTYVVSVTQSQTLTQTLTQTRNM